MSAESGEQAEGSRFGKYTLLRRVAIGGMAEIYLALEESPHAGRRFVTIKRIRGDLAGDLDYVDFFLAEGRVSLKCNHPNLPQAFDLGVADGMHYLAMEFIRGHTLLDLIRNAVRLTRPISPAAAVRVGVQVAAALEHAHSLRDVDGSPMDVIHRDVSPQNIMIDASGGVKLIDFGIVRSAVQLHATKVGTIKGKFSYMAPEQIAGKNIDARCDIFALGICLHETLTGRSLFRGKDDRDTLKRVRRAKVPAVSSLRPDVPSALSDVVAKCLERDPKSRYASAHDLLVALEEVAESCQLYHSMTKLRDEVVDCCGEPPSPQIDPALVLPEKPDEPVRRARKETEPAGSMTSRAPHRIGSSPPGAHDARLGSAPPRCEGPGDEDPATVERTFGAVLPTPTPTRKIGLAADPELQAYLAKAGWVPVKHDGADESK